MKKKQIFSEVRRLSRKGVCILATALMCTNSLLSGGVPVLAQINTDDAYTIKQGTDGGDRWSELDKSSNGTYTHRYSSYESSKEKALKVDASYGFKLQKTKQTKVSVKKGDACSAPSTYQGSDLDLPDFLKKYTWFKTAENTAGNIQLKISNLKIYQCESDGTNGHWITVDLVRTVTGIEKYQGENGYVALGDGITNAAYVGLEEVTVHSDFYRAGTESKVTLKSNVTLSDIDSYQYIGISAAKIDGQYVAGNTILSYQKSGEKNVYFANSKTNYDGEASTAAGFIFEDSSFVYTFGRDGGMKDGEHIDAPSNQEQYVGSGQAMTQFQPANPTKSISDDDETEVTKNTLRDLSKTWIYTVEQTVPSGIPQNFYYDKFEFQDQVEECMKILSVKVMGEDSNSESKDVSSMFQISTTGNQVVATLKNPKNAAFYENTVYQLQIKVKMDVPEDAKKETLEALRSKWKAHGHLNQTQTVLTEKNNAKTVIDEYQLPTNDVSTELHLSTGDEGARDPGLQITKDVNRYEHQVGDVIHYTVKVKNTNKNADTAYFTISDTTLPDTVALDMSSVKVTGIDAAAYTISQSGNGWVLTSKGDYALPYGTTITITYDEKALVASNGTCVDNTASAIAAGIPEKSDKEQVYINSPKVDVVKSTPSTKHKVGDTVGYKVTITNRNLGTFMRDLVLKDLVKAKGLEVKEGTVAVLIQGKDVTNDVDITYAANGKGFTIRTNFALKQGEIPAKGYENLLEDWIFMGEAINFYALPYADQITVTYDATITDEAALESSLENVFTAPATENTNGDKIKEDETIPSGGGEDTEDVTMKAPQLEITKKSNKPQYAVGETGKYTLEVKQTKEDLTAKNVVITDTFVQEDGMTYDADSLAVTFNHKDITKDCKITVEGNHFKIATGKNLTDEDEMEVTYRVVFSKTGEYTNTAVSTSENTPEDQAHHVVEVKEAEPDLDIEKASNQTEYTEGETGTYTLNITQKNANATAKNVILKDSFKQADGLEIQKDTLKVVWNGEDITKDCKMAVNSNNFYIETGKDMTSKDTITVTYDVRFTKTGTYENKAGALAENAGEKQDDNTVKVLRSDVIMTKDADKKSYKEGETVNYTVAVALKKEGAKAKNVVIRDQVPKELKLLEESVKVQGVKGYSVEVKDNTLTVTIPEMSYGEKAVITYQATVLKTALGKKLTNQAMVNGEGINGGNAEVTVDVPKPETPKSSKTKTPGSTDETSTPQTGDTKTMMPYVIVSLVAGAGAVGLWLKKRKLKK